MTRPTRHDEWPECVRDLPVCPKRQLPIPFITERDPATGIADYPGLDPDRKDQLIRYRLCGVCGKPLGYWMVFLGDIVSTQPGGAYVEPPLHEDCALAAMQLCPFIASERVPRRPANPRDVTIAPRGTFETGPRRDWVMAYTRGFTPVWHRGFGAAAATLIFRPARIMRTRRFTYRDGKLTEVPMFD